MTNKDKANWVGYFDDLDLKSACNIIAKVAHEQLANIRDISFLRVSYTEVELYIVFNDTTGYYKCLLNRLDILKKPASFFVENIKQTMQEFHKEGKQNDQ